MTRAAIYARFSSDLQDARSIGDQVALCCDYAQKQGYAIARVYEDACASGASIHGRPGIQRLLAEAETKGFDVLIAESMSRIGRDQEDRAGIRKRLKFFGIGIETPGEGVVSPLVDGVRAVIDSEMLEDMKRHTRRGMRGRIKEGLSGGGLTYGYRPGDSKGKRVIEPQEAATVLRIFGEYVAGRSPRAIAEGLNADQITPPRGRDWTASAINGNPQRGSGILANALYDGRLVWNRVTMRKNPQTGRRVSRVNPTADWITTAVPDLRIVPAELFSAAQAIKSERGKEHPSHSRRPRHMLAGLLRCGCCGSAMAINNVTHVGRRIYCGRRKEGGRCANGKTYQLEPIEQRVLVALRKALSDPRMIEIQLAEYRAERKRLAAAESGKRSTLERAAGVASRAIERIVDAIASGTMTEADARVRLPELRQRRDTAQAELAAMPPQDKVIALHPAAVLSYLKSVEELAEALRNRIVAGDDQATGRLRELVMAVVIHPKKGEPDIQVTGRLAQLTGLAEAFPSMVVAGSRYHHWKRNDFGGFELQA
jgi:site-specific DNA recombinase